MNSNVGWGVNWRGLRRAGGWAGVGGEGRKLYLNNNKNFFKAVYIYTMEYYSTIKNNEILSFATAWMDLEGIMLSEISQIQNNKYYMISLMCRI